MSTGMSERGHQHADRGEHSVEGVSKTNLAARSPTVPLVPHRWAPLLTSRSITARPIDITWLSMLRPVAGYRAIDDFLQGFLGLQSYCALGDLTIDKKNQGRNAHHVVLGGQRLGLVHV